MARRVCVPRPIAAALVLCLAAPPGFTQTAEQQLRITGSVTNVRENASPTARVLYVYVVDGDGRLRGVVPTRRLLLSKLQTPIREIMVSKLVSLPSSATVLDACEFFIQHRFLAFPVVDHDNRLLGVVDVDLYVEQLAQLDQATLAGRLTAPFVRFRARKSSIFDWIWAI